MGCIVMSKNSGRKDLARMIGETRAKLVEMFPKTFFPKGHLKKPLKRGIMKDLVAQAPELKPYAVKMALRDYCKGPSYHVAFAPGANRVDLDGNEVEALNADSVEHARKIMSQFKEETQEKWRSAAQHGTMVEA